MVSLLMRMHKRLIDTKNALEASLQGKQGELASQPTQTAVTVEAAPPMAATSVPPIMSTSTTCTSTPASTSATISATTTAPVEQETSLSMENMMKEIKALEI